MELGKSVMVSQGIWQHGP